ncbi:MAG: pentapeptide repeat-containing protein [Lentisphaeraceae bacterium]|nr:pentapeptide repeat-containing protein [Lentisphaeraceae bacterium]
MPAKIRKGFKVTNKDMTCLSFQFELNKWHHVKGEIVACSNGFHWCKKADDCFNYYSFNSENRVFEIEAKGKTVDHGDKSCSRSIRFVRELTWTEVLEEVNTGKNNTGRRNSGDRNSGYRNSGDWNSGDWNSCNRESGFFNSKQSKEIRVFNKPCKFEDWEKAEKPRFIFNLNLTIWVWDYEMSDKEKEDNPNWEVREGYLKTLTYKGAWREAYKKATKEDIKLLKKLPNFDAEVFKEITGLEVK